MVVRKLVQSEYEIARGLYCNSFQKEIKNINMELLGELFGIFLEDELIGMVQFDFIHHIFENIRILYINGFCIKEEYRNKGYGDKLLKWCCDFAKENNFDVIQMTSNKNRVYAHKLYKNNDFEVIDTIVFKRDIK